MNMAVCLLAYAMSLTVLGPALLSRGTLNGAAPRFGVCAWLLVMGAVLAAWIGALALFLPPAIGPWDRIGPTLTGCLAGLGLIVRGGHGALLQIGVLILAIVSTIAVLVLTIRTGMALRRAHRAGREHVRAARIAAGDGPPGPGGALVIDSERRGVYCLAGRPHTIVITRGALDVLDEAEAAAVISHERAHLTGHHHRVLVVTRALSKVLPRVRLFTDGAAEVARLLEMCADDAAAHHHTSDTVVDAILALSLPSSISETPPSASATPLAAMSAAGLAVTQRVERLLFPPNRIRARANLTLLLGVLIAGPAMTTSLMVSTAIFCP